MCNRNSTTGKHMSICAIKDTAICLNLIIFLALTLILALTLVHNNNNNGDRYLSYK